jgi:WD40 repeat protein
VGQDDGAVSVVDARTLRPLRTFPVVTTGKTLGIGYVPGTHLLVTGGPKGFLALVDTDAGRIVKRLRGHTEEVFTPGISRDGRTLITGSPDRTVRVWRLPAGRHLYTLRFPGIVNDAQLSPDGRWLSVVVLGASEHAGIGETLEIWDVRTRRRVKARRPQDGIDNTRFSPDGRMLAIGNGRGRAQVLSTRTWAPITRPFLVGAGPVTAGAISPDGRTLATGDFDGGVRLWDIRSQQAIGSPLPGIPNRLVMPAWTPDGAALFTSYDTGRAYRWDVRRASLVRHACAVAGRTLTRAEWAEVLPGRDYAPAC